MNYVAGFIIAVLVVFYVPIVYEGIRDAIEQWWWRRRQS